MKNQIFTFSIKAVDRDKLEAIQALREECKAKGLSFSHVCIEALMEYISKRVK